MRAEARSIQRAAEAPVKYGKGGTRPPYVRAEARREAMAAVVAQLTYESMMNALGGPHA